MTPEFCTSGPTRKTRPPGVSVKRSRPLRKSWSDRFRLEATNPATSMRALDPIAMPLELSRNTRPLEASTPSITLCGMTPFAPTTRLSTAEDPEDCRNRVISLTPIEKLCQLMMALALLVIVNVLPELAKLALPELTVPPVGLARLCPVERLKQAATDSAISLGLKSPRCLGLALELDMATPPIDFVPAANGDSF